MNENKTYKTAVLDALDKAVQEVFGNNLEHFFCPPDNVDDCCVVLSENPADCLIWVIGFVTENF